MESGIYCIRNLVNGKIYIGSSVKFKSRWKSHIKRLNTNKHGNDYLQKAYNKYGKDNFSFEIVSYVENKENLIKYEQYWLDFFKPEYNICKIAGSTLGTKRTDAVKERMSLSSKEYYKNNIHHAKGKEPWNKGKKHSAETILKLKLSHIGQESFNKIEVFKYDLDHNFIEKFESMKDAANSCNGYNTNLRRSIKQNKSYKGFIFKNKTK